MPRSDRPLANHRVILGVAHFDATAQGGEGRVFTDLALDLARRTNGIHAFTADGARRGTHLNQIQGTTGRAVIAPPRRRTGRGGGIVIDGHGHAAQPLPWSGRRQQREAACGGHQLWASAGTLFEQIIPPTESADFANWDGTRRNVASLVTKTVAAAISTKPATPSPPPGTPTTGGSLCCPPPATPSQAAALLH